MLGDKDGGTTGEQGDKFGETIRRVLGDKLGDCRRAGGQGCIVGLQDSVGGHLGTMESKATRGTTRDYKGKRAGGQRSKKQQLGQQVYSGWGRNMGTEGHQGPYGDQKPGRDITLYEFSPFVTGWVRERGVREDGASCLTPFSCVC